MPRTLIALLLLVVLAGPAEAWPEKPPLPGPEPRRLPDRCVYVGEQCKCTTWLGPVVVLRAE